MLSHSAWASCVCVCVCRRTCLTRWVIKGQTHTHTHTHTHTLLCWTRSSSLEAENLLFDRWMWEAVTETKRSWERQRELSGWTESGRGLAPQYWYNASSECPRLPGWVPLCADAYGARASLFYLPFVRVVTVTNSERKLRAACVFNVNLPRHRTHKRSRLPVSYVRLCVCVCLCVCERERERGGFVKLSVSLAVSVS